MEINQKTKLVLILLMSGLISVSLIFLSPRSSFAQDCNGNPCPPTLLTGIGAVVPPLIDTIITISVIVFFIIFVINGFNFITSLGYPKKIENSRKSLIFSLVGFALIFAPFIIIPAIASLAGLKASISINPNGTISTNLQSNFTSTPLPTNAQNTTTATTTIAPSNPPTVVVAECGASPADCVRTIQQYRSSTVTDNLDEYDASGPLSIDAVGDLTCAEASITTMINAYTGYFLNRIDAFEIKDVLGYLAGIGDFSNGTFKGTVNDPSGFTDAANQASQIENVPVKWDYKDFEIYPDCGGPACINQANNEALQALESNVKAVVDQGYPVMVTLYGWGHSEVIKKITGTGLNETIYTANSGNPSDQTYAVGYFIQGRPYTFITIKPSNININF